MYIRIGSFHLAVGSTWGIPGHTPEKPWKTEAQTSFAYDADITGCITKLPSAWHEAPRITNICYMGVSYNGGTVPPNGWFIMENHLEIDNLGYPLLGNFHMCIFCYNMLPLSFMLKRTWIEVYEWAVACNSTPQPPVGFPHSFDADFHICCWTCCWLKHHLHWIGFVGENLNRKPWFNSHQIDRAFRLKFSHHPILWHLWWWNLCPQVAAPSIELARCHAAWSNNPNNIE